MLREYGRTFSDLVWCASVDSWCANFFTRAKSRKRQQNGREGAGQLNLTTPALLGEVTDTQSHHSEPTSLGTLKQLN